MKSSIANNMFLKKKLEIAKRAEFEERLQLHMYQKASILVLTPYHKEKYLLREQKGHLDKATIHCDSDSECGIGSLQSGTLWTGYFQVTLRVPLYSWGISELLKQLDRMLGSNLQWTSNVIPSRGGGGGGGGGVAIFRSPHATETMVK